MQQFPYPTPRYVVVPEPQVSHYIVYLYTMMIMIMPPCFDRVLFLLFCFASQIGGCWRGGAHTRSELVRHNNYPPSECDCSCNCSTSCPCPCRVHVRIRQLRHLVITLLTYFLQQTQHTNNTTKWTVWMHLKYIYLLPPPLHKIALIVPVFFSQTDWAYQMNSEYRKLI